MTPNPEKQTHDSAFMGRRLFIAVAFLCLTNAPLVFAADGAIDFSKHIQPLLAKKCVSCHGAEKQKSGLRLDRKAV